MAQATRAAQAQRSCDPAFPATVSVLLGYQGAAFAGFARQPGQLTVQGQVEQALSVMLRRPVEVVCAGRTDAGVHARGQVVSFDVTQDECERLLSRAAVRSLNALTHDRIAVQRVDRRPAGFSARFDAVEREYRYHVHEGAVPSLFASQVSWHVAGSLDVDAMQEAARCFVGEHDFKSFCKAASAEGKPTCRFVREVSLHRCEVLGEPLLQVRVVGNAFLHSMVRTMVGSLVAVGRGQRAPEWIAEALKAADRRAAGECAPAQGLVFWEVRYA
ncbi:tRNA pseudouridine(38-40) synthase TruA [Eggerthellaceae bacterium zg-1084]|uniref:tRNA pseudouridine synthase A n=2 Tax=Berryella wangjianweii TaxID=2734634 RepID=A0A6M8J4J8_9ACTN|nr:tRNA pseudouridine(38-40) synthase TruA [Berryella wangjianweii]QKF08021.1 tRNA pseudouridine(38-40) synthase TruA [Berryella wangjianweii]